MILTLDNQVAPFDLCLRLQELGAPQFQSLYTWVDCPGDVPHITRNAPGTYGRLCSAYTVAELGMLLPQRTAYSMALDDSQRLAAYFLRETICTYHRAGATEAEARAKLLIALAEGGDRPVARGGGVSRIPLWRQVVRLRSELDDARLAQRTAFEAGHRAGCALGLAVAALPRELNATPAPNALDLAWREWQASRK